LTDLWVESDDVIAEAGHPAPENLGFPKVPEGTDEMTTYIEDLILPGAQGLINQHLGRSYTSTDVPDGVKYCAIRVAARGLMNIAINKKGGLITVNQWMQALADPTVFTPELKAEIQSFALGRTGSIAVSEYKTHEMRHRWDADD
jgi:hypothetical protein